MPEPKAFVKNAADPKQVKEAKQKEKFGREQELRDIAFVLSTIEGRRLIWRYLGVTGIDKVSFNGDVNWTLFYEGQRNVGLKLKADIMDSAPMALIQMMTEAKNKEANEQEVETKGEENA
jgi:hypothetical protein